ncbi:MAG: LacI family transcriptional regulator [Streptococcaceae bacterium]|jgi:LacI family transcriptional regulator|nr:LacI family transcriptional regulator [Streptococcaceae bacterium]
MTTIKQVARHAGVSPTTVSNVLHGRNGKISPQKLKIVQDTIEKYNYAPNMGARILSHGQSQIIGVITFYEHRSEVNIIHDTFHSELLSALESKIRDSQHYMMLYTVKNYEECMRVVQSWDIDGLIVVGTSPAQTRQIVKNMTLPVVFIDTYLYEENEPNYYNVGLDDFGGAKNLTRYLIAHGHRRIAFLANSDSIIGVDLERLKGFEEAHSEQGLPFDVTHIIPLDFHDDSRRKELSALIESGRLLSFDALFFASDYLAVDSMNFLREHAISTPDMISIVGFDDSVLSRLSNPKLTTVQQNVKDKGEKSVDVLLSVIQKNKIKEKNLVLPTQLIKRETVKEI